MDAGRAGGAGDDENAARTSLTEIDRYTQLICVCQFRGRTYSVWQRFTVLTRSHLRPLTFQGNELVGVQPPRALRTLSDLGGGIVTESYAGCTVRVTTFGGTLVDLLDTPDLGGGWVEICRSLEMVEYFDLDAVITYTLKLSSAITVARVGFFLKLSMATRESIGRPVGIAGAWVHVLRLGKRFRNAVFRGRGSCAAGESCQCADSVVSAQYRSKRSYCANVASGPGWPTTAGQYLTLCRYSVDSTRSVNSSRFPTFSARTDLTSAGEAKKNSLRMLTQLTR